MAKGEAPRRRLIASDSEDEAPPAEPTFEDEPEVPEGEMNFPSVARRIRAPVPIPAEGEERPADAFAPALDALNELRGVDMSDPASVAKLAEHGIVDAVLDLLRAKPPPSLPARTATATAIPRTPPPTPTRTRRTPATPRPRNAKPPPRRRRFAPSTTPSPSPPRAPSRTSAAPRAQSAAISARRSSTSASSSTFSTRPPRRPPSSRRRFESSPPSPRDPRTPPT